MGGFDGLDGLGFDPEILNDIQNHFKKIQEESGVEIDEDDEYQKELEELIGMTYEEMNEDALKTIKTKNLKVELLNDDAKFPEYAYPSDSGFDLYSTVEVILQPFGRALVPTGIKLSIPEEYEIQVRPKSGLAINQGLTVLNTPGTVDSGYNGEIKVIIFNTNNISVTIPKGMKVAQAVLCPVVNGKYVNLIQVDKINDGERGDNGFGSTGINVKLPSN
jgi:dUTP pyrophosphatase